MSPPTKGRRDLLAFLCDEMASIREQLDTIIDPDDDRFDDLIARLEEATEGATQLLDTPVAVGGAEATPAAKGAADDDPDEDDAGPFAPRHRAPPAPRRRR